MVAASLVEGADDGVGLLADALAQLSLYRARKFGQATPKMVELLRGIGDGLRARPDRPERSAAITELRETMRQLGMAERIAGAVGAIELAKSANIDEMARILENEAGSYKDQPIIEKVGQTVLNRMRRNETADVMDLRRAYAGGQRAAAPATRNLATMLLNGQLPDTTDGATHFYQPYAMDKPVLVPKSKDGRYLTDTPPSGYEYVPEVTMKDRHRDDVPSFSRRPNWADGMRQVPMSGTPDSLAKFFVAPGNGHVQ